MSGNQATPVDQARRGSGRSMALVLAAQLWADSKRVALFRDGAVSNQGMIDKWLNTLRPDVRERIAVYGVHTLDEVRAALRGRNFDKVFVDHAIVEHSERMLTDHIKRLQQDHEDLLKDREVIR